jgi:glycosyltransferase involved in cell wall biosynthesis
MASLPDKLRVLMVCAHEPTMDPRIRWEAEQAGPSFDVTVLGFSKEDGSKPELEFSSGYKIIRLTRCEASPLEYILHLKATLARPTQLAMLLLALPIWPVLILTEIVFRLLRQVQRLLRRLTTVSLLIEMTRNPARSRFGHHGVFNRIEFIILSMRRVFAPAAHVFWNHICNMQPKPDVVHCNDLETLLVGVLARKKFGCRLIYDAHEFWPFADSLCTWVDKWFFLLLEGILIKKVDAVVSVSPMLSDAIRRTYGLKHVHTVPNVEPWVAHRAPLAKPSPMACLAEGRVKFLFQGRFTIARGIEEIIRAWNHVDGKEAALFLRGPDNTWKTRAMELATRLGLLNNSVYFLDAVSEDELVSAAAEADVGIVPYLPIAINERLACPNKLSQYLHAGLMIITNDLPYVKSVVQEANAGLCYNSSDISTLAQAVMQVINDPGLLHACKQNALRFARDNFNWQNRGDLFLNLYRGEFFRQFESVCTGPGTIRKAIGQ